MKLKNLLLTLIAAVLLVFSMSSQSFAASSQPKVVKKVTTTVTAHVRKGPSSHYTTIGYAKKGSVLSVIGSKNNWYKVKWSKSYGYVYSKWTKNVPPVAKLESSIVLATTTSTQDSGLLDAIIPLFEAKYDVDVKVVAVGTGQALKMGEQGDADVVLVHDRKSEDKFVKDGYGTYAWNVMYNQFLLVGPKDDPAGIKGSKSAVAALKKIYSKHAIFISRGDDSGTNKKEIALWKAAGLTPSGDWYKKAGLGMGDTLRMAEEMGGYTLADEATFQTNKTSLVKLVYGQNDLFNPYGVIKVKSTKKPNASKAFIDWIVSKDTQKVIGKYGKLKFGKSLFVPNASKR